MNELDESMKHQATNLIHEFQKIDDLLNDYGNKFSKLTVEISELETELIIWKNEREELSKSPANDEEVKIWAEQINKIDRNKKHKESELAQLQKKIDDLNLQKESLKDVLEITELEHTEYLINQLKKYFKYSEDDPEFHKEIKGVIINLNLLKSLWEILDKKSELIAFIKFFKSNEIQIDLQILNRLFNESISYIFPPIVPDFLDEYLKDFNIIHLVDSTCRMESLIFQLKTDEESQLTCFLEDVNEDEVIRLLYPDKSTIFSSFDTINELHDSKFDVVIGSSGMHKSDERELDSEFDGVEAFIRFIQTSRKLKEEGVAFFILNNEIRLKRNDRSIYTNIEKYDLYIDSIIRLAAEIFPERDSNKTLLIIKRKKPEKLFIGELNNNSKEILLDNLKERKEGKIPQHGTLTDLKSFYSFPNFLAVEESKYLGKSTGLVSLRFKDIVKEVCSFDNFSESEEDFNYIFLPSDYNAEVALSSQSFKSEPERYLQIFFDPEVALSDYVARFYDTQLGKKIRESVNADSTLPQISKKLLYDSILYLPDLNGQIDVINVNSIITELSTRAENYKRNLWKFPKNVSIIKNEIEDTEGDIGQKIEKWIENLPFPLASIIWASLTVSDYSVKVKYLIDFFEAFSEFNCVLMLSGLASDLKFFEEEYERCQRNIKPKTWYNKPTFGTWNFLGDCLSSTIRILLKNNKKRSRCIELFGNPDPEFLERITNTKIKDLLLEVANYRNQWDAHGPRVSSEEYQNRYKIMEGALLRLYQLISDVYENSYLLIPGSSIFRDGIHNYTIRRLMGTRGPFRSDNIETTTLMDSKRIYFFNQGQRIPVELLPFIHISNDNCYFYNSLYERDHESFGQLRYISYHYSEQAEIEVEFEKLRPIFLLLKSKENWR